MKRWRKALTIVLIACMALALCACGKGKKKTATDPLLAKQNVYRLTEFDFSSLQGNGEDAYTRCCVEKDGKLYLVFQTYKYSDGGGETLYRVLSMDRDGGNVKVYDLQSAMEGSESRAAKKGSGSDDVAKPVPADMARNRDDNDDTDADETPVTDDVDADETSETDGEQAEEDGEDILDGGFDIGVGGDAGFYEYTGLGNFQIMGSDRLIGIKDYNYEDYSDPENYISIRENYVCCWDLEGKMLWETPLEGLQTDDSWSYVNGVAAMKDGTAAVLIAGDKAGMRFVDENGKLSDTRKLDDKFADLMERYNGFYITPDGVIVMNYYDENWSNMYITTYDLNTNTLAEGTKLPASVMNSGMNGMTVDANGDLLYASGQGVFKYHVGDEEPVMMMNFVNSDLEISGLNTLFPIDNEHFIGVYNEYDDKAGHSIVKGGIFTKVDPADIPDKEVLLLAGSYMPYDLRKRAVEFNKNSDAYRIVLRDYSEYQSYDDYNAGVTKLNNDIISGGMPDILIVEGYSDMKLESYIAKGLLADIGKLIEKDEELSQTEFLENAFEACKVNGKLYEIIPSFNVSTYIGKTSLVGDRMGWTMEEAQALLATMPAGTRLFSDMTNTGFINVVMEQCGSDFVNVSTGKCSFDSPEFIALMEYANTLGSGDGNGIMDDTDYDTWYKEYENQYRENRTLLANCYIGSPDSLVYSINGTFGEDVSYVGFPSSGGQGAIIMTNTSYALSAKSANLDAAWDFMRYYLTEEYQDTVNWQIPITKKKFEENFQKATQKPYYEDENGERVDYEYSNWINGEEVILDPLTQQQVDKVKEYVTSVTKRSYRNQEVVNIITEEIEAYFNGDKSAKDTAAVIQSRVQIYVNENR